MSSPLYTGLHLFLDALTIEPTIRFWHYDAGGTLLETNSPHHVLHSVFSHTGCLAQMLAYSEAHSAPLILSARMGLVWCAVFQSAPDGARHSFVLGPIFHSDSSTDTIADVIRGHEMEYSTRQLISDALRDVAVVPSATFFHICLMLHYFATGEKLQRSDLTFLSTVEPDRRARPDTLHNRNRVWQAERALLQMVRDGDVNYRSAMERASQLSSGVGVTAANPVLAAIVSSATFTGLCSRAAIDGGLTPDEAYTVGDGYVQRLLACETVSDVRNTNHEMYEEFIARVHRLRVNPDYSAQTQACIDYVETHLEDDLDTALIARHFGYARHYLSRRFKAETGTNLSDYIRYARIERAKKLLVGSELSVREIAELLRFSSSSHFSDRFRAVTGMLPLAYRRRERS
ncbi:MAG: AraC family transcriptional regulator [Oscillospiraceae bacterium]|nr:AraC family transcriptional regulator [Oscillospiraceae bacterium]